jgi:hypothetical protein
MHVKREHKTRFEERGVSSEIPKQFVAPDRALVHTDSKNEKMFCTRLFD